MNSNNSNSHGQHFFHQQDHHRDRRRVRGADRVDVKKRLELYHGAIATFVPTDYIEPFGGVNVESQMCGTPVITTDFGAFPETVEHGKTGFRCRTLDHFICGEECFQA